jgi:hypothetical protein
MHDRRGKPSRHRTQKFNVLHFICETAGVLLFRQDSIDRRFVNASSRGCLNHQRPQRVLRPKVPARYTAIEQGIGPWHSCQFGGTRIAIDGQRDVIRPAPPRFGRRRGSQGVISLASGPTQGLIRCNRPEGIPRNSRIARPCIGGVGGCYWAVVNTDLPPRQYPTEVSGRSVCLCSMIQRSRREVRQRPILPPPVPPNTG